MIILVAIRDVASRCTDVSMALSRQFCWVDQSSSLCPRFLVLCRNTVSAQPPPPAALDSTCSQGLLLRLSRCLNLKARNADRSVDLIDDIISMFRMPSECRISLLMRFPVIPDWRLELRIACP